MVQIALETLWDALRALAHFTWPLLMAAGVLLAVLAAALLTRARAKSWLRQLGAALPSAGRWLLAGLALGFGILLLDISRRSVNARLGQQLNARYSNGADPEGSQTEQASPSASYLENRTYSRSLTLPEALYKRLGSGEGWREVLGYLGQPSDSVQQLDERFEAQGRNLVYRREQTLTQERPIPLSTSTVEADLSFGSPHSNVYNATFNASYTFSNPLPKPVTAQFQFPLPRGSGTLSDFRLTVDGRTYRASDLSGASVWEGTLTPQQRVNVTVTYRHQGSRGWRYLLTNRREAIGNFALTLRTDRATKFARYSLYPSKLSGSSFGPRTLEWNVKDILTAQNVDVVFTQNSLHETLSKMQLMMPLALLLAAGLSALWAWSQRLRLTPLSFGAALLALSLGFTLGGVLTAYLHPLLAEVIGAALGAGAATLMLGRAYAWTLLLAAALPLTFLSAGNAGLLLVLLSLAALLTLWRTSQVAERVPQASRPDPPHAQP